LGQGSAADCQSPAQGEAADADPDGMLRDREGARRPRLRAPQARSARPPPRDRSPRLLAAKRARLVRRRSQSHRLRHREGDVEHRYQWCSEMLADLQQFLMGQDVVFTAKTLSQWLKETFQQEIERERQQLEAYKRVGRDGLIAGVPAAEAKLDVVEHLGEAG